MLRPRLRTTAFRAAMVCLAALLAAGCRDAKPAQGQARAAEPVPVRVADVQRRAVPRAIDFTGTIYGEEEATISSKSNGRLAILEADLGDEIAPGQPLARIDPTDYELALAERRATATASLSKLGLESLPGPDFDLATLPAVRRARAEEANAKAKYERAEQLYRQVPPLISAQDFADMQTQWEVSSRTADAELLAAGAALAEARTQIAAVAIAQQQLADTVVRAPAPDGGPARYRVAERRVSVGELVAPGQPLFRLVASDRIKFRGAVPERFSGQVRNGQQALLYVEAFRTGFAAVVSRVAPQIDVATRSFEVEILADNPHGALKPGAFARASIVTGTEENVAFVPAAALVTFAGVQKVYGVNEGKAVEYRVTTGVRDQDFVEIVGDFPAAQVVVEGTSGLSNGTPVSTAVIAEEPRKEPSPRS